jgi:hypothetical protein
MASPLLIINGLAMTGHGPWRTLGIELLGLPVLLGVITLPLAVIAALVFRRSTTVKNVAAISAGIVLGGLAGNWAGSELRMMAFQMAADRAAPVISAIEAFEGRYGTPPKHLSLLVPEFLASIPESLPPLTITVGDEAINRFRGNRWAVTALASRALLNWDMFVYLPNQNYGDLGAASMTRLGDWAYLHE